MTGESIGADCKSVGYVHARCKSLDPQKATFVVASEFFYLSRNMFFNPGSRERPAPATIAQQAERLTRNEQVPCSNHGRGYSDESCVAV